MTADQNYNNYIHLLPRNLFIALCIVISIFFSAKYLSLILILQNAFFCLHID